MNYCWIIADVNCFCPQLLFLILCSFFSSNNFILHYDLDKFKQLFVGLNIDHWPWQCKLLILFIIHSILCYLIWATIIIDLSGIFLVWVSNNNNNDGLYLQYIALFHCYPIPKARTENIDHSYHIHTGDGKLHL